ncbi:DUF4397 domain-containing protein [Halosimplex halobium]|uniref:DUF4397 domain-containing protein n=1 Tax=Halosimplex halobium TaxID=3396618 RepID=UPI003F54D710
MTRKTRRDLLAALGASAAVGLAGCGSDGGSTDTEADDDADETDAMDGGMDTETDAMDGGMDTETETDAGTDGSANVRVAHFSPDAPNVNVTVNGDEVLADVAFSAVSDYLELPAGTHTVALAAADGSGDPFETDVTVEADTDYTLAALGEFYGDTEFRVQPFVDDNSPPDSDTARVRLVHASPDAPAVDVTAGGGDTVLFDGVPFGESGYVEVPAGTYTLGVRGDTESNDGDVVAEFTVELAGGTVYTGFAGGYLMPGDSPADEPFDLTLAVDAGEGGGGPVETGSVRVAHMSPDAPNVDVYVDDSEVLSDVPFGAVSDYLSVPAGERTVTITAADDAETVAFEGPVTVGTGDYTIVAAGELMGEDTEFQPLVLEDDNSDPGGDSARLRVVHGSPDAPAVDVTAAGGDVVLFDGVAFGESGYTTVEANDYTVQIRGDTESNDGDIVADYDVSLNGGTVYTAFAQGYLTPEDEPADENFDLNVVQDASY